MANRKYHYYSGEEIHMGDVVLYPGVGRGKVEKIIIPHSREALLWNQPRGGVFFHFERGNTYFLFDETNDEEDLEFICRGTNNSKEEDLRPMDLWIDERGSNDK